MRTGAALAEQSSDGREASQEAHMTTEMILQASERHKDAAALSDVFRN